MSAAGKYSQSFNLENSPVSPMPVRSMQMSNTVLRQQLNE